MKNVFSLKISNSRSAETQTPGLSPAKSLAQLPVKSLVQILSIMLLAAVATVGHAAPAIPPKPLKPSFKVVHYNIRELDCEKLSNAVKDINSVPQIREAVKIIKTWRPDFLSINEVQYDRPGQPNRNCATGTDGSENAPITKPNEMGLNMARMAAVMGMNPSQVSMTLGDSNTGQTAQASTDGTFSTDPVGGRNLADPVNFGLFPGQYSVGAISKFRKLDEIFTKDLVWSVFNPEVDLSKFLVTDFRTDPNGISSPLDRNTFELFDKNFTDMVVEIQGKPVHMVLLHTVVGGAFGGGDGSTSPNELRNAEELAFLEWYLTGKTILNGKEFSADSVDGIKHLPAGASFVAMGDWNVDVNTDPNKPGAIILNRIFSKTTKWHKPPQPTQQTWHFKPNNRARQLDYIVVSRDIKVVSSGGYFPNDRRKELGCFSKPEPPNAESVIVDYRGTNGSKCYASVSKDYYDARTASDHYPIWAELRFK